MIIKSSFRRAGGLATHLLSAATNERVRVRDDLFRAAPPDVRQALRLFDGISRTNKRTIRSFVHVIVSPAHDLTELELSTTLKMIEEEHRSFRRACHGSSSSTAREIVRNTRTSSTPWSTPSVELP